jgi:hypothetical protein
MSERQAMGNRSEKTEKTDLLDNPKRVISYVVDHGSLGLQQPGILVWVTSTSQPIESEFHAPHRGSRLRKATTSILEEGSSTVFYSRRSALMESLRVTKRELAEAGFSVLSGNNVHRIYVMEYCRDAPGKQSGAWLYVGQTSKSREERISEHQRGIRAAKDARYFSHRREDLEPQDHFFSVASAEQGEVEWGAHLAASGYLVRGPRGFAKGADST